MGRAVSDGLAFHLELLVETFARKIAALAIDAGEQKGRADRAEAEVERLRVEYEPGHPVARDAALHDFDVIDGLRAELAAETKRADQWEHEAKANASKLVGEMNQRRQITELRTQIKGLEKQVEHEREGCTKRRRDKTAQWKALEASRDAATAKLGRAVSALRRAQQCVEAIDEPALDEEIDAILADAESKAAGEAFAAADEYRKAFPHATAAQWDRFYAAFEALATGDARRGGG